MDKGDDFNTQLEQLIDTALEAEAEDFDQSDIEDVPNTVEVEARVFQFLKTEY